MTDRRRQRGFALVLVLVLLMVAAVALTAAARQSASEALSSREATEALQRRWAVTSCRSTLLPRAAGLLDAAQRLPVDEAGEPIAGAPRPEPGAHLWVSCTLAGIDYDLVLTNEQAKYNPSAMGQLLEDRPVRPALESLARSGRGAGASAGPTRVVLRPMVGLNADGTRVDTDDVRVEQYAGYGQLFDPADPAALLGTADAPGPAARVTCWGDGRLQLAHAGGRVVAQVLGPVLGDEGVHALVEARKASPELGVDEWMKQVPGVSQEGRQRARSLLTETSRAQGLWVVARGPTRSWYSYSVRVFTPVKEGETLTDEAARAGASAGRGAPDAHANAEAQDEEERPDPLQRYDMDW
ncbi:MAG: hypothetical protein ACE37H_06145 [Phycisphaeraceae bacterium]